MRAPKNSWQRRSSKERRAIATQLANEQGWLCYLCGRVIDPRATEPGQRLSVDHVMPLSKGGADSIDNMRIAHARCNSGKGDRVKRPIVNPSDNLEAWML